METSGVQYSLRHRGFGIHGERHQGFGIRGETSGVRYCSQQHLNTPEPQAIARPDMMLWVRHGETTCAGFQSD